MRKSRSYQEALLENLSDPSEAAHYLNAAMEDSLEMFLVALKDVAQAQQMSKVAKEAGIKRETLYRSFSEQGNPTAATLVSVLKAVGLKLAVSELEPTTEDLAPTPGGTENIIGTHTGGVQRPNFPKATSCCESQRILNGLLERDLIRPYPHGSLITEEKSNWDGIWNQTTRRSLKEQKIT
jgi:probable addiction module antidote protein